MGKTFIVTSLEDMCRMMCDNDSSGMKEISVQAGEEERDKDEAGD